MKCSRNIKIFLKDIGEIYFLLYRKQVCSEKPELQSCNITEYKINQYDNKLNDCFLIT